jgi:hypothetical protein
MICQQESHIEGQQEGHIEGHKVRISLQEGQIFKAYMKDKLA